jgi:cyclic beta-1,2-glucan synthetase
MHRAAIESICGLCVRAGSVCITPQLPSTWPQVTLTLRHAGRSHRFIVCAAWAAADIGHALADGARVLHAGDWLRLADAADASRHLVVASTAAHAAGAAPSYNAARPAPMVATGGRT